MWRENILRVSLFRIQDAVLGERRDGKATGNEASVEGEDGNV